MSAESRLVCPCDFSLSAAQAISSCNEKISLDLRSPAASALFGVKKSNRQLKSLVLSFSVPSLLSAAWLQRCRLVLENWEESESILLDGEVKAWTPGQDQSLGHNQAVERDVKWEGKEHKY